MGAAYGHGRGGGEKMGRFALPRSRLQLTGCNGSVPCKMWHGGCDPAVGSLLACGMWKMDDV